MSTYVMSDIHGCYDEFIKMLDKIKFNDKDKLYILGDIIDRGPEPIKLVKYIMSHPNCILIKGNHEQMFLEHYDFNFTKAWYRYGGIITHNKLRDDSQLSEKALYEYFKNLSFIQVVDKFILVHSSVYIPNDNTNLTIDELISLQDEDFCIYDSSIIDSKLRFKDYTIITGHKTVQNINNSIENVKIIKTPGLIHIDCGCCFKDSNGKLSCLRLDDMQEFYI